MSLEEVLLQACLNFRGSVAEPISLFPSKCTQMPDKQTFFNSAHCAPEQESYRLLISPGGTLFGVCFQKKRQDCFLAVFSGKINEDKINFSISHRGVTIRLDDFLYDFKQAKKKKKQQQKKKTQVVRLYLWGWIIYHPGGFSAEWICQLSVFVLKETFAESKHLHCKVRRMCQPSLR